MTTIYEDQAIIDQILSITEEKTAEQQKLQAFVKKELVKLGVDSPAELTKEKRKELFAKVDKEFKSDDEESGKDVEPEDKEDVNEAVGDEVQGRFWKVTVANGATGEEIDVLIQAKTRMDAEKEALDIVRAEDDIKVKDQQHAELVVDGMLEISQDEFESTPAEDIK